MIESRANPITARLLVRYDRSLSLAEFRALLGAILTECATLEAVHEQAHRGAAVPAGASARAGDRNVAVLGLMGTGTAMVALALAGTGTAAAGLVLIAAGHGVARLAAGLPGVASARGRRPAVHRVWLYAREDWRGLAAGGIFTVLSVALSLSRFLVIGAAVDLVVSGDRAGGNSRVLALGGAGLLQTVLQAAFDYAGRVAWSGVAHRTRERLRMAAYEHLHRLDIAYFEDESSGRLAGTLTHDADQIGTMFDSALEMLRTGSNGVLVGAFFLWRMPGIAVAAMAPIPLILLGANRLERRLTPRLRRAGDQLGSLNARISAGIDGISTIRSFAAEPRDSAAVHELSAELETRSRAADRTSALASPMIEVLIMGGTLLTLVSARGLVQSGRLSPGGYASTMMLTGQFLWPVAAMGQVLERYRKAAVAVERLFALLDEPVKQVSGVRRLETASLRGALDFSNVHFAYRSGDAVLKGLDLAIGAGETVALVGATGCGKSTIAKLLLRLYEPQAGSIAIDGIPIQEIAVADLRRAIGIVSQDVFLFDGTILDNVRFGDPEASLESVARACRSAELLNFIERLPKGFHTRIGERGIKLSGGQRQRLSIARAILRRPGVLILDEATSALDHETEAAVYGNLADEFADRTLVIIAHRLSTIRNADRIYFLEQGRSVEQGSHDELLARGGRYAAALSFARTGLDPGIGDQAG